jgi:hypothetical protein
VFTRDSSHRLAFSPIVLQIFDNETSTEARQVGASAEICPVELMAKWIYNEKFLSGALPFTTVEDDDLERSTPEQKNAAHDDHRLRGLENSTTTFQAAVRQLALTNLIDGPARPLIGTPSITTRSSRLALNEIRTTEPGESA